MNRFSMSILSVATSILLARAAAAQTTRPATSPVRMAATPATMPANLSAGGGPTTRLAAELIAAFFPPTQTRQIPAARPATGPSAPSVAIKHPTTQPVELMPRLPNATLCTVEGWARATSEYAVSQQILASLKPQTGQSRLSRIRSNAKAAPQPLKQRETGKFYIPITSPAATEVTTSEHVVERVFRECTREEYERYARRWDRPLIVNFIEDYPKLLAAQCQYWKTPVALIAPAALPQVNLATIKPQIPNEFEFHRLEADYQRLQSRRFSMFAENLVIGPAVKPRAPVVVVISATLEDYDFANKRYGLKTPIVSGALPLKDYFASPAPAFDGCVVFLLQDRRWEIQCLPLGEAPAEKLRTENAGLIMVVEGYVRFKSRLIGDFTGLGAERSILLEVSKATFIAVPKDKPLYEVAAIETGVRY